MRIATSRNEPLGRKAADLFTPVRRYFPGLLAVIIALAGSSAPANAEDQDRPKLLTHQSYVEDVLKTFSLPIGDPKAVFAYVLENLPDRVKVYPTEN